MAQLMRAALADGRERGEPLTTLIAAEAIERIVCGIELDPAYVDVTIARWQQMTGKQAVHAVSGKSFDELRDERLRKPATEAIDQLPRDDRAKKVVVQQRRSSQPRVVHPRSASGTAASSAIEPSI